MIHLVAAGDALALRPLMQPWFERTYRGKSFAGRLGDDLDAVRDDVVQLLREKPRTKAEIKTLLAERGPDHAQDPLQYVLLIPAVQVTPRGCGAKAPGLVRFFGY